MTEGYVDTTVLTDILLKSGEKHEKSLALLKKYNTTKLPVYAIKEFKAGPLKNYAYIYNKLVTTKSYEMTVRALQALAMTPMRYKTATALEALSEAAGSIGKKTPKGLKEQYGEDATMDKLQCDEARLTIRYKIESSWIRRRNITTEVVDPLICYKEVPPKIDRKLLLDVKPDKCNHGGECCMAEYLKSIPEDLKKLKTIIDDLDDKNENRRRTKSLRELYRTPKRIMTEDSCKSLGDAVFSIYCPEGAVILTTNKRDHEPLAEALGKSIETP